MLLGFWGVCFFGLSSKAWLRCLPLNKKKIKKKRKKTFATKQFSCLRVVLCVMLFVLRYVASFVCCRCLCKSCYLFVGRCRGNPFSVDFLSLSS